MLDRMLKAARILAAVDDPDPQKIPADRLAAYADLIGAAAEYFSRARSDAHCSRCGAPITWVKTAGGKNAPLDAVTIEGLDADGVHRRIRMSHFGTCPAADAFRPGGNGRRT